MFVTTNYDCLIEEISITPLFEIKGGSPCWRELQYEVYKYQGNRNLTLFLSGKSLYLGGWRYGIWFLAFWTSFKLNVWICTNILMPVEARGKTDNSKHLNGLLGKLLSFMLFSVPNETSFILQHRRAAQRRSRARLSAQVWDDIPPKYARHISESSSHIKELSRL